MSFVFVYDACMHACIFRRPCADKEMRIMMKSSSCKPTNNVGSFARAHVCIHSPSQVYCCTVLHNLFITCGIETTHFGKWNRAPNSTLLQGFTQFIVHALDDYEIRFDHTKIAMFSLYIFFSLTRMQSIVNCSIQNWHSPAWTLRTPLCCTRISWYNFLQIRWYPLLI